MGYTDEYGLEDITINVGDFIQKSIKGNFSASASMKYFQEKNPNRIITPSDGVAMEVFPVGAHLCNRNGVVLYNRYSVKSVGV